MYERMLNKQVVPTIAELTAQCGDRAELFTQLNEWLADEYATIQEIVFPYGNQYGWGIAHKKKKKLMCNIFAEDHAFTVMIRLSQKQFESVYENVQRYMQDYIDNKYPCGDGGWIHCRVLTSEHLQDVKTLLYVKCK